MPACAGMTTEFSLDHLVGEQLHRVGHVEAEYSRRLQVEGKFEFRRLQHRQVGGLGPLEDAGGVNQSSD